MIAFDDAVREAILGVLREQNEAIERACEEAIQGGVCGVRVIRHRDLSISVGPDLEVPYGQRWEVIE